MGYTNNNNNQIDSYGVNHSGFNTQDELQYQNARINRENNLITQMNNQGITTYPQYSTNFWGNNPDNNYGFGSSNIANNIENIEQNTKPDLIEPKYWESSIEGKNIYDNIVRIEGNIQPQKQNILNYATSAIKGGTNLISNFNKLNNSNYTDKYKHAFMNCNAAQYGQGGADISKLASNIKEIYDTKTGANSLDSSQGDQYANQIGRLLGCKYPNGDCDELVQRYIKKFK